MIDIKILEKAADWWADQVCNGGLNWDNGAQNQGSKEDRDMGNMMWMLGNLNAMTAREKFTPEQKIIFKESLVNQLKVAVQELENYNKMYPNQNHWTPCITLSVDYSPGQYLYEPAEKAKIDTFAFPCKSCMWIYEDSIRAKVGYGAEDKEIFHS